MQPIEITIENPALESEFDSYPLDILDGSLTGANLKASESDFVGDEIPASLAGSGDVEIRIEGIEELTGEYKKMKVCGVSAAITHKGAERFIEEL